jgi:hypothetical protein
VTSDQNSIHRSRFTVHPALQCCSRIEQQSSRRDESFGFYGPTPSIADSSSRNAVSFSSALTMNLFPLWRCTRTSPFLSTQVGCRLARRLRRRTKVQYAAVGSDGKIAFDYVIRRLNALSSRLKSRSGGLTFAETPPSAISGSNWSPESAEVRPLQSAS